MDLYDVKARGIRGPLNSREISHLFRAGHFHRRVPCKPRGEATWRTIGELFPLLEYGIGNYTLPPDEAAASARRLPLKRLSILLVALTGIGAFFFYHRSPPDTAATPPQSATPRAAAPVILARN